MPNIDYQHHSFLGGEVSPRLYARADMEKFGRWFSKAENIRFHETGGFRNRNGFYKVAKTKNNVVGENIKLLSFSFNDEESFLIELGPSYARFYKHGVPITVNGSVYELETPFSSFGQEDLKYAQSGDTIFITHPTYGIYELARLQSDGTSWEIKKFNADILPMSEVNDDSNKTLSATAFAKTIKKASLSIPSTASSSYKDVRFTYNSSVIYTAATATQQTLLTGVQAALSNVATDLEAYIKDGYLYVSKNSPNGVPADFSISYAYETTSSSTVSDNTGSVTTGTSATARVSYANFASLESLALYYYGYTNEVSTTIDLSGYSTLQDALDSLDGKYAFSNKYTSSPGVKVDSSGKTIYLTVYRQNGSGALIQSALTLKGKVINSTTVTNNSVTESTTANVYYTLTSSDTTFFSDMQAGDCVLVNNIVDSHIINGTYSSGTQTLGPISGDGGWRIFSTGTWKGTLKIDYSVDNKNTWVEYYDWESYSTDINGNINTAGTVTADSTVWFRIRLNVTAGTCNLFFSTNAYRTNSYYKILFKNSDSSAVVECIKNDVGAFSNKTEWRLPAWSNSKGWPQTVGFYQNRLFFGKDYILYGSKTNDFWDFYEPVSLAADDPVTMSLLSTKVNNIKNIVTQRSFFAFTGGGEFGIGSDGALTQNDKYLKPFSSNGSAKCNPVLISDVVLFVDKSYNSVRALKYSLESDGYEAPDITITLKQLLEKETIISTEHIFNEKEALFLSQTGTIWVLKYITDQNVLAWSHWKHAYGKITNICVVPNGAEQDLYISVETSIGKHIELLKAGEYMDTVEEFGATTDERVAVTGDAGSVKCVLAGNKRWFVEVDEDHTIEVPTHTEAFKVGSAYVSDGTLLSPVIQTGEYSHSNYEAKKPFKIFFYYLNSYGFKVGVEEEEKMAIEWQNTEITPIDDELQLTSGKKSVLIPSRFDGSARVSFVQEEPYPMDIEDVLIQVDYGGK